MRILFGCLAAMLLAPVLRADVVKMTSGNEVECVVLQENPQSVVVRIGYGTMSLPRTAIASVRKSALIRSAVAPTTVPTKGQRVPPWNNIISAMVKEKWATDIQPIPATVIDVGVMKNVPYQSYRCGLDYEINIYGDPDHPAAIELGVYRSLLTSADAKRNCVEFIASILGDKVDAAIARALDRTKDLATRNELTIEITPPNAPDAYGGWWISVYSEKDLDSARATEAELDQIAVAKAPEPAAVRAAPVPARTTLPPTKPQPVPAIRPTPIQSQPDVTTWSLSDISRSRSVTSSSSVGGRVYVRGYYRKNGTYVRPHTRSR